MTKEEKVKKLQKMFNSDLLETYKYYIQNFNPIDDDIIESKELTEKEILSRMGARTIDKGLLNRG